jgi:hypothetical protein
VSKNLLSFEEGELVKTLLEDVKKAEVRATGAIEPIMPVGEWLQSYHHTGEIGLILYPFWKTNFAEICSDEGVNFNEIIITGSLSSGKSFFSDLLWLRLFYILSNMESPQRELGLSPTSKILFAYLSISVGLAKRTGFDELTEMLDSIPYFVQSFPRDKNIKSVLSFPKGILVVPGSDASHFTGGHLFSIIFDEANFAKVGGGSTGDVKKAFDIYNKSRNRIRTRFAAQGRKHTGLSILVSSNTHQTSFTEQIITQSQRSNKTKVIVTRLPDVKPEGTYSKVKFLFFLGNEYFSPCVIDSLENLKPILGDTMYSMVSGSDHEGWFNNLPAVIKDKFYMMPEDFRDECVRTPEQAVQDIVGYSLAAKGKFFSNVADYNFCISEGMRAGLRHPFTQTSISAGCKDTFRIMDFVDKEYLKTALVGKKCYVHVDLAENKCSAGIGVAYPYDEPGQASKIRVPLLLRITPPAGNDSIDFDKIVDFIMDLSALGVWVYWTGYDSWQSTHSIQKLTKNGFNAGILSTWRDDECWLNVVDLFFKHKIEIYDYAPLRAEFFNLEHDRVKKKVDKPKVGGLKDVSDSFVGCVTKCSMDMAGEPNHELQESILGDLLKIVGGDVDTPEKITEMLLGGYRPMAQGRNAGWRF